MITVVIADDHAVLREGLAMLLGTRDELLVIGQAGDGKEAVDLVLGTRPDVVLMDISMPGMDGIEATRAIYAIDPGIAVVILTTFADDRKVQECLAAGAVGYLLKDSAPNDLIAGVLAAGTGGSPLDPRVARALVEARRSGPSPAAHGAADLTAKQRETLALLAEGLSNRLIARRMGISEKTVKTHLTTVYRVIGVTDRVQAAMWAKANLDVGRADGS